jgi:hypothetical protein
MKALHDWAMRHHVGLDALRDLDAILSGAMPAQRVAGGSSESAAMAAVRLEASRAGVLLFRNNVGVLKDETGRPVRYGLANESAEQNKVIKSGDLIGIRPVLIEPRHVGHTIGQFVSREVKRAGWHYTGKGREAAQMAWVRAIVARGGDACFCTGEGTL